MSSSSANSENVKALTAMGFPESQAIVALLRANNDINRAAELLSNGLPDEDDAEFDLIAAANPEPEVHPATVFVPRNDHGGAHDPFADVTEGSVAEMVDARISVFTEMGFSAAQAVAALQKCNNDINEALTLLLASVSTESV